MYADVFYKTYGLETIGLRYFNVFGPKQDPDGAYAAVIPKFINHFLNNKDIIINGDGKHSRDFTFIENVVQANMKAILSNDKIAINQVYNVAFGENTDLNKLVTTITEVLNELGINSSKIKIINGSVRGGDVKHSLADISKANNLLEYIPLFSFEEGIRKTITWYIKKI